MRLVYIYLSSCRRFPTNAKDDDSASARATHAKEMFPAATSPLLVSLAAAEDVDGIAEVECVGFRPRAVRSHQEGEEAAAEGARDDRLGELHVPVGVAVPQLLSAQQVFRGIAGGKVGGRNAIAVVMLLLLSSE